MWVNATPHITALQSVLMSWFGSFLSAWALLELSFLQLCGWWWLCTYSWDIHYTHTHICVIDVLWIQRMWPDMHRKIHLCKAKSHDHYLNFFLLYHWMLWTCKKVTLLHAAAVKVANWNTLSVFRHLLLILEVWQRIKTLWLTLIFPLSSWRPWFSLVVAAMTSPSVWRGSLLSSTAPCRPTPPSTRSSLSLAKVTSARSVVSRMMSLTWCGAWFPSLDVSGSSPR